MHYLWCLGINDIYKRFVVMEQYISKSALVAEIEKFIKKNELYLDDNASDEVRFQKIGAYSVLCDLRHFIDTIEVKEVDLDKEVGNYLYSHLGRPRAALEFDWTQCDIKCKADKLIAFAKHFFELGMAIRKEKEV